MAFNGNIPDQNVILATRKTHQMRYAATLEQFDMSKPDTWKMWINRFRTSLRASGLHEAPEEDRVAHLLTAIGGPAYTLISSLTSPKNPESIKFEELISIFSNHLAPTPSCILARFKFHKRFQRQDENIADYAASLRELAVFCDFGNCLEHSLRDQFIAGIWDTSTQEKLFRKKLDDVTFTSAMNDAIAAEKAKAECQALRVSSDTLSVGAIKKKPVRKPFSQRSQNSGNCLGCGQPHTRADCPFKKSRCRKCHKRGHLEKVCLSKADPGKKVVATNAITETINKVFQTSPIRATVKLGESGIPVSMEVDSGSPVSILNEETFLSLELNENDLLDYSTPLFSYSKNRLNILGLIQLPVQFKRFKAHLEAIVIKGNASNLLGRNWFESLGIQVTGVAHVQAIDVGQQYIKNFPNVFSSDLGTYQGPPISLNIDSSVSPISCLPRRLPIGIKPAVEEELDKLIEKGVLIPVKESKWATPIVPIPKPDGGMRICADYRVTINKGIKPKV